MMKSGTNEPGPLREKETGVAGGKGRKKMTGDDEEGNFSDKGEEDEEEETARKNRLGLNKKGGDDEDDEGGNEEDDLDDDSSEKGKHIPCYFYCGCYHVCNFMVVSIRYLDYNLVFLAKLRTFVFCYYSLVRGPKKYDPFIGGLPFNPFSESFYVPCKMLGDNTYLCQ